MKSIYAALIGVAIAATLSFSYDELPYTAYYDSDIDTGEVDTMYRLDPVTGKQMYYALQEQVYVDSGATLYIDSGAIIFGNLGPKGQPASALICAVGGKIIAQGTEEYPIIMTCVGDDPDDPFDLGPGARNMWGGLVVMGKAEISNPGDASYFVPGRHFMEGLDDSDPRAYYGAPNSDNNGDNSGVYKYISIRHGGSGDVSNEEVNGMTFGGVGSGTTVEHIEVFANADDAFEFFGGVVNTKWLVGAYCGDDHFDYDEGFRGKGQFWFSIHEEVDGDRGGEHDGLKMGADQTLYSKPTICNATYIGGGRYRDTTNGTQRGIYFRDSAGGHYINAIVTDYSGEALKTSDIAGWDDGLKFENSIFFDFGKEFSSTDSSYLFTTAPGNVVADPMIRGVGRHITCMTLDPRVSSSSPAFDSATTPPNDGFFDTDAVYCGAFDSSDLWIDNWTALAEMGILSTFQGENLLRIAPDKSFIWHEEYTVLKLHDIEAKNSNVQTSNDQFRILVDGVDVTSSFLSGIKTKNCADGSKMYYIIRSTPSGLVPSDGAPEIGPHTIQATLPHFNGVVTRAQATFEILK